MLGPCVQSPPPSFNERVELIVGHERCSAKERAQAMASEERDLIDLFRRAEMDYETRLLTQVMMRQISIMIF